MKRSALYFSVVMGAFLVGCDADGDGLSNYQEKRAGTSSSNVDSDGDGLSDGDEKKANTDPLVADSDGDGYPDGAEVARGSDPTDANSLYYTGGWPYYGQKDRIVDPGFANPAELWSTIGRFKGIDQFGEEVDLYDFAGHGKLVMIDISAEWCPPCREMARWMEGGTMQGMEEFEIVREAVGSGEMYWVTVIAEDVEGNPGDFAAAQRWAADFPHPAIPVLAMGDTPMSFHMQLSFYPSVYLIHESMVYISGPGDSWTPPLYRAKALLLEARAAQ